MALDFWEKVLKRIISRMKTTYRKEKIFASDTANRVNAQNPYKSQKVTQLR